MRVNNAQTAMRGGIADEELSYKSLLIWLHPCSVEKTASRLKEGKVSSFCSNWCKDKAIPCKQLHLARVWFELPEQTYIRKHQLRGGCA